VLRSRAGEALVPVDVPGLRGTALLTAFCTGAALEDDVASLDLVTDVARTLADLQDALASYPVDGAPVPREHVWSLDALPGHAHLVDRHLPPALASFAADVISRYAEFRRLVWPGLHRQPLHADFNLSNVLTDGERVTGVIDFGDTVFAPRVYDVAIALTYLFLQQPERREVVGEAFLAAYELRSPLSDAERDALPLLISVRALLVVLLGRAAAEAEPARAAYALRYDAWGVGLLEHLAALTTAEEVAG
jgi:hydroxylysine kinase